MKILQTYIEKSFLFFTMLLILASCSTNKKVTKVESSIYKVNFSKKLDFSSVLEEAKSSNKLIYLDMGAEWCTPCQQMKKDVYTDEEVAKVLNKSFISYLVDSEKGEGPDLKLIFEVYSYPTLLFIDQKGTIIEKHEGSLSQTALINAAKNVVANHH